MRASSSGERAPIARAEAWLLQRHARGRLVRAGCWMETRRLVTGSTGNLSLRHRHELLITPSRMRYHEIDSRDIVAVDLDTGAWDRPCPSVELPMHLALYRARPDVGAIVHTHSPYATAWSFTGCALAEVGSDRSLIGPRTEELDYYGLGDIPTTAIAYPAGSQKLAEQVVAWMPAGGALLLREHGVLVAGRTLSEALSRAEAIEHQAQVSWLHATAPLHVAGRQAFRPSTGPIGGRRSTRLVPHATTEQATGT